MNVEIDPEFHGLIAAPTAEELAELEASLKADGCRDALMCWGDILLDGHNRLEICGRLEIPFQTKSIDLPDREAAAEWIITNQLARRNITLYQRGRLVLKREGIIRARAKERQRGGQGGILLAPDLGQGGYRANRTDRRLAKMGGMAHETIRKVRVIEKEAPEEVKKQLIEGKTTVEREYNKLRPKTERHKSPPPTKAQRIDMIRDMAGRGYRASQIAPKVGITVNRVRELANKSKIVLPDAVIGKVHKLDVNRMVNETVMAAEAAVSGMELIESRLDGLDASRVEDWLQSLSASITVLNRLKNWLRKRG